MQFSDAFKQLLTQDGSGFAPFVWQGRLYEEMLQGRLPTALDLPTGLGKTSVLALWLIAQAHGAPLPRRLIYVVDRRTVVDQATEYAQTLREALRRNTGLRDGLGLSNDLSISTLRGQFADNREWLSNPAGPAIVIGTVDMIGSRLLFEGYGVSRTMRPMHAGLLAWDSLLVLDEAHLSQPFARMVEQLGRMAGPGSVRFLSLSATQASSGNVFRLTAEDRADPVVEKRLSARKDLVIHDRPKASADDFAEAALELVAAHPEARLLVFRENFDEAMKIAAALRKKKVASPTAVNLLTGRRRGRERDQLLGWLRAHGFLAGTEATEKGSAVLIATSAGEVGIDLDAHHMLCDLVSLERMVQRLGRVNRRGDMDATVHVWDLKDAPGGEEEQRRRQATRALLGRLPGGDVKQAGPGAICDLPATPDEIAAASTPPPLYPELTLAVVEAWSMTSLQVHAGRPEVGPWLRGWEENAVPETVLVWREHLPVRHAEDQAERTLGDLSAYLTAAPLRPSEKLQTRSDKVLKWLKQRGKALEKLCSRATEVAREPAEIAMIVLSQDGSQHAFFTFEDIEGASTSRWKDIERSLAGRTLLLARSFAGLDEAGYLDAAVNDPPSTSDLHVSEFLDVGVRFVGLVARDGALKPDHALTRANEDAFAPITTFITRTNAGGEETAGFAIFRAIEDGTESESARSVRPQPQLLSDHAADVMSRAEETALALNLPSDVREALVLAARHHDDGKAEPIWQRAAGAPEGGPWAKIDGKRAAWDLKGYRHEFGSLAGLEKEDLPSGTRDLILHLVAAHHGSARPILRHAGYAKGPPSQMAEVAGRAAVRFARLSQELGPWKLAWLEALLRAADQQASKATAEVNHG